MVAMASQFCDADGHNCDSDKLFVTALYGERGSGHNRCSQAAFEWWTGGNETPDNYIMVDSSLHNPTSSLTEGGSIESLSMRGAGSGGHSSSSSGLACSLWTTSSAIPCRACGRAS
jgi:hypothetical protein